MKSIYVTFEDREFNALKKVKKDMTWHNFILILTKKPIKKNDKKNK